jgi:hypothetical protein
VADKELTEQQSKVLDEVEASMAEAMAARRRRLGAEGLIPDGAPHMECLRCMNCDHYTETPSGVCTCGHGLFSHNII